MKKYYCVSIGKHDEWFALVTEDLQRALSWYETEVFTNERDKAHCYPEIRVYENNDPDSGNYYDVIDAALN